MVLKVIKFIISTILFTALILGVGLLLQKYNPQETEVNFIVSDEAIVFPEPKKLIEIEIDTNDKELPSTKAEGSLPVVFKITVDKNIVEKPGEIKVQGTSTAHWPKKNWSIKLYEDEERTKVLKMQIGDSILSDKWIAKADWIDPTMLRNNISYRLWGDIVSSRTNTPKYEVNNALLEKDIEEEKGVGAQGFPRVYTARIKINDEHYGITNLILGHDPNNFNIDKENPKHMYLEFDARFGYTDEKTWAKLKKEGIGEWISGYYPETKNFTKAQEQSIDDLGKFINGSLDDFKQDFDKYLDKTNMIDMLLFMEAIGDWDAVAQDIEMVTYDLEKWYMLPWDKDTTFGMYWDESGIEEDSEKTLLIDYENEDSTQKPWYKTYHAFTEDVERRYKELRDKDVLTVKNLEKLINNMRDKISKEVWEAEEDKWNKEGRPSVEETNPEQILLWFKTKLEVLDKHFNYK